MTEKRSDEMRALADCCERSGGFCGNGLYGEIERLRGALADAQYRLAAVDRVVDYYSDDAALTSRLRVALKNRAPRPVAAQLSSVEPGEQR